MRFKSLYVGDLVDKAPELFQHLKAENPLADIDMEALTPAMHQFAKAKQDYPDCIIFFRMGDFYETFYQDAEICSKELGITLTARGKGDSRAPLAGIPFHAVDTYLPRLIKRGYKVAICEQIEDPKQAKGIVKRAVIRVVTPGTVLEDSLLDQKSNNYLAAVFKDKLYAFAVVDISTGEFLVASDLTQEQVVHELLRFHPTELVLPKSMRSDASVFQPLDSFVNYFDDYLFQYRQAYKTLISHFHVLNLHGFGIEEKLGAINVAGGLLQYVLDTQKNQMRQINSIRVHHLKQYMVLDRTTILNLELLRNIREGTERGTLFYTLNKTITPMGARMMRSWLLHPLLDMAIIRERHDAVEEFTQNIFLKEQLRKHLGEIYDLERLIARINYGSANARDLLGLRRSLEQLPQLKRTLLTAPLNTSCLEFEDTSDILQLLERSISEEAPAVVRNGNLIKAGYSKELDDLRDVAHGGKGWLLELEQQERQRTGINSLKVGFTRVFGYYIDITKTNLHLVPPDYIRKQTTANGERFITPELKEKEALILTAEERILDLEYRLFMDILKEVAQKTLALQSIARKVAQLDCILSFAHLASSEHYTRPVVSKKYLLEIIDGRHPVVEQLSSEQFVPNDCVIDSQQHLLIITGPNMAGKSTYLRQVALIQLMMQIGSFVPAKEAVLSCVDRIFCRVGASDDLSMGQSTFMVEMSETANILNNATQQSLIILDEIGRGTSTYDGVSIAWAVAEYIHNTLKAKALFATHYHQLNTLKEIYPGIENYYSAVKEMQGEIIFLRKIIKGSTDKSYGVEVARLAGLPSCVINRAKEIMATFEKEDEVGKMLLKKPKKFEEPSLLTGWLE